MAIEFLCPYCTAAIRVPDSASGKRGTCPKCGTKVVVPTIEVPAGGKACGPGDPRQSTGAEFERGGSEHAGSSSTANDHPSALGGFGEDALDETIDYVPQPVSEAEKPAPAGAGKEKRFSELSPAARRALRASRASREKKRKKTAPVAQRVKRRRRRRTGWAVPLLFVMLLAAGVAGIAWQYRPRMEGELEAQFLPQLEPDAVLVERALMDGSEEKADACLARLAQRPETLTSNLMHTEFRGSPDGLLVQLRAGRDTQFYRVPAHEAKAIHAWLAEHARHLDEARRRALRAAATEFLRDAQQSDKADAPLLELPKYRDSLGLNALVGGFGYAVVAVRAGQIYRCVFEDEDGNLYFLLPKNTKRFEIRGRDLPRGETEFPGRFVVTVDETPVFETPKARSGGKKGHDSDQDIPGMAVRYGLEKKKKEKTSSETKDDRTMTEDKP